MAGSIRQASAQDIDTVYTVETSQTRYDSPSVERTLPDTAWVRISSGKEYAYRRTVERYRQKQVSPQQRSFLEKLFGAFFSFINSEAGRITLWIAFLTIVIFVLVKIITGSSKFSFQKKGKGSSPKLDEPESAIQDADWADLARTAATGGDYRTAIRFGYRSVLQRLDAHNIINYDSGKSDAEYYRELLKTPLAPSFRPILRQYERSWFGGYVTDESTYQNYQNELDAFLRQIPG